MTRTLTCRLTVLALAVGLGYPAACLAADKVSGIALMSMATSRTPIETPMIAKQMKLSGSVEVGVTVDEGGAVEKADVVRGNPILGKAAADAVKKWKFKPYKQGDAPIKVEAVLTFEFK